MPIPILNSNVVVIRRSSTGRDSLGNPTYGSPTSGAGWNPVYYALPVFLAFSSKLIRFAKEGERIQPNGVMYFNNTYNILPMDHIVTYGGNIEYVVVSVIPAYIFGNVVDHYECILILP